MRDMGNVVGNVDDLRAEREARMNPPKTEAGQGDSNDWAFFDDNSNSAETDQSAFTGSEAGSSNIYGDPMGSALGGALQQPQQQQVTPQSLTETEDKIIGASIQAAKFLGANTKELFLGFQSGLYGNDAMYWSKLGSKMSRWGIAIVIAGSVLMGINKLTGFSNNGFWVMIGGLIELMGGILILTLNFEKAKELKKEKLEIEPDYKEDNLDSSNDDLIALFEDSSEDTQPEEQDNGWGNWGSDDNSANIWDTLEDEDTSESEEQEEVYQEDINIEAELEQVPQIQAHTQTRQFLFEQFTKVLPLINPNFSDLKLISENSDNFIIFDKMIHDASIQCGAKEDNTPVLIELRENLSIIQIKATRPAGIKEQDIANEIANMYSRNDFGKVVHEGVSAIVNSVGAYFIINLFTGNNPLVSLGDIYKKTKDFVLDTSNKMPLIWGIDEFGDPIYCDADNIFSYIISGIPRSGKSWKGQSMVLQLCMFNSPREVTFEAFDVKGLTSDFHAMAEYLPHFKKFESDRARIIARLRYLTTVEANRRSKILKEHDVIAIKDLKEKYPEVELPYLYIIIDEMLGLKEGFTKDEEKEFQGLLNMLVSQLPNLGFRVILVPHRIVNDIISKTTYTLVGCRACIKAPFNEIKNGIDVTQKEFPYSLPNLGDMALKVTNINSNKPVFCHGEAITKTNDGNKDVFKYVGAVWNMLEPREEQVTVTETKKQFVGHDIPEMKSQEFGVDTSQDNDDEESFWDL